MKTIFLHSVLQKHKYRYIHVHKYHLILRYVHKNIPFIIPGIVCTQYKSTGPLGRLRMMIILRCRISVNTS